MEVAKKGIQNQALFESTAMLLAKEGFKIKHYSILQHGVGCSSPLVIYICCSVCQQHNIISLSHTMHS